LLWLFTKKLKTNLIPISQNGITLSFTLCGMVLLSGWWIYLHNAMVWGNWSGQPYYVLTFLNKDGLPGAIANAVRYFLQSFHFLYLTDVIIQSRFHISLLAGLQHGYDVLIDPIFEGAGAYTPFRFVWLPKELEAWFGPLAPFLLYPSVIYGLWKGDKRMRVLILTVFLYASIICYQIAWMPFNGRFLSPAFTLSCIPLAFVFDKLEIGKNGRALVLLGSFMIFFYAAFFNMEKPLLTKQGLLQGAKQGLGGIWNESVYAKSEWGTDRLYLSKAYYKDDRVYHFQNVAAQNAIVGILAKELDTWIYHYMYARPDLYFVPIPHWAIEDGVIHREAIPGIDYLVTLKTKCRLVQGLDYEILWTADPDAMPGSLVKIKPNIESPDYAISHWHLWNEPQINY
jgi:hypothetical protein